MTPNLSEVPNPEPWAGWAPRPTEPGLGPEPELGPYEPAIPPPSEEVPPWAL